MKKIISMMVAVMAVSCSDPFLQVYEESLSFGYEASVKELNLNSSVQPEYSIAGEDTGWCTVTPSFSDNGFYALSVSVSENLTSDERSCSLVIASDGVKKEILVSQAGKDVRLEVSSDNMTFRASGGEHEVEVLSNTEWSVEYGVEWIEVIAEGCDGNGYFTVRAEENDSDSERSAELKVVTFAGEHTISVLQSGKSASISVSGTNIQVMSQAAVRHVDVFSSFGWNAISDSDWCRVDDVKDNSFQLVIDANDDSEDRSAMITVDNGKESCSITVMQKMGKILLSQMWAAENIGQAPYGDYFQFNEENNCPEGYVVPSKKDFENLLTYAKAYDDTPDDNPGNVNGMWFGETAEDIASATSDDINGCVFFPASGCIAMAGPNRVNENGYYWTRNFPSETSRGSFVFYETGTTMVQDVYVNPNITNKRPVRCIKAEFSID